MEMWEIPYLGDCLSVTCHTNGKGRGQYIMMTKISYDQEEALDNGNFIDVERDNKIYHVGPRNVVGYGEIDFNNDSVDMQTLENFDLIQVKDLCRGEYIPRQFDYEQNLMSSEMSETFDFAQMCKFTYCKIGKPDRCLIFKYER